MKVAPPVPRCGYLDVFVNCFRLVVDPFFVCGEGVML